MVRLGTLGVLCWEVTKVTHSSAAGILFIKLQRQERLQKEVSIPEPKSGQGKQSKCNATALYRFSRGSVSQKNLGSRKLLSQKFQIVLSGGPHSSEMPVCEEAPKGGEGKGLGELQKPQLPLPSLRATQNLSFWLFPAPSRPCPISHTSALRSLHRGPGGLASEEELVPKAVSGPHGALACPVLSTPKSQGASGR